jgi:hypothetical protein
MGTARDATDESTEARAGIPASASAVSGTLRSLVAPGFINRLRRAIHTRACFHSGIGFGAVALLELRQFV